MGKRGLSADGSSGNGNGNGGDPSSGKRSKKLQKMIIFSGAGLVMLAVVLGLALEPWKDNSSIVTRTEAGSLDAGATNIVQQSGLGGSAAAAAASTATSAAASVSKSTTTTTYSLLVTSADMSGNAKTGMYTTIREGSETIKTGFTPLLFTGQAGVTYTVSVANFESSVFERWEDDSRNNRRTITLPGDTTITAYYRTESTPSTSVSGSFSSSSSLSETGHALIPKTGVLVPLYMYPGSTGSVHWQKVIDEKNKHPSVPMVAIFNPSSGPGSSKDNNIANWVNKLQDAGVIAIGYVPDGYADTKNPGARSMTYMKDAIQKYHDWYGADGIFFDEFSNKGGYESRYIELTEYSKTLGAKVTVGNPGASVPKSYIGTVDVLNVTEGKGYMPISWLQHCSTCSAEKGWQYQYDKRNFSLVRYDISSLDTAFIAEASKWAGLMYITDGNDSNARWMHVPLYFGDLVAALDR